MSENTAYDRSNNDTYVERYSLSPVSDAEAHMFQDPAGRTIGPDRVSGNFTTETKIKAENSVLHFPEARQAGLISLNKSFKIETPMPMSLVRRYERSVDGLTHAQKTPVFFDSRSEQFVVLLDERFLRDIEPTELALKSEPLKDKVQVYYPPRGRERPGFPCYLGLMFSSIEEIRKNEDHGPLKSIIAAYRQYNLRIEDGEKVILLKVAHDDGHDSLLVGRGLANNLLKRITNHRFRFEFVVAYRFGTTCYLQNQDGGIDQAASFHLDKIGQQNRDEKSLAGYIHSDGAQLLVIPYTEQQHQLLIKIHSRMTELAKDVQALVELHQRPTEQMDSPIDPGAGALPWIKPLLLDKQ